MSQNESKMNNKEIFENVFTSLDFISQWCKNFTKNDFEQNLMLIDAVAYRLYSVGTIAEKINISKLEKDEINLVNRLIEFKTIFSYPDFKISMLGELVYDNQLGEIFRLVFFCPPIVKSSLIVSVLFCHVGFSSKMFHTFRFLSIRFFCLKIFICFMF